MGKKPRSAKSNYGVMREDKEEQDQELNSQFEIISDDEEADEDLSLKIVEKAMLRACEKKYTLNESKDGLDDDVINCSSDLQEEVLPDVKEKKKKKEKLKKIEEQDNAVDVKRTAEEAETIKSEETDALVEMNYEEKSDNLVLRKLLRGPRYFDPPDNSWGTCYNCGEAGHMSANCTSAKRKKPCFVCGSLEHNVKQCMKGKDCFICKKGGHRARDCPEKSAAGFQKAKICLKCGDSGHDMFSCDNIYSPDDLKEVQCYVCKCFGHLCCVNYTGPGPKEISCYRCGQLGHFGLECARQRAETTNMGTPSSCFRCGEEGHMAKQCASSAKKITKQKFEYGSVKWNYSEDKRNRSAPHDLGKARKKNRTRYEGHTSPSQTRQRGGWITEDPGDFSQGRKYKANGRRSPATPPSYKTNNMSNYGGGGGYASISPGYGQRLHFGNSPYNGSSAKAYQHRFSASRFGNSSSSYGRREYDWQ